MSTYNFKREAKVYLVQGDPGDQYNIDISEISFTQTFKAKTYPTKTIQSQSMFEGASITSANKATFNFTFPVLREDDLKIVFDRLLDCQTFDLYISTKQDVFKLRNCVITNGDFIIERLRPLSMNISGEASQLSKVGTYGVYTIPGTPQSRDASRTYNRITHVDISLGDSGGETISENLVSVTIELQNKIKWLASDIVGACSDTNISYPEQFVIDRKVLGGTITTYITDTNNTNLFTYNEDLPLFIEAGQDVGATVYGFKLDMDNCSFTNRLSSREIFTQSYDWRMTQNPSSLSSIITYVTV